MSTYRDRWPWWHPSRDPATAKPAAPTLETEANPEVGRLLGPDGRVAVIVRARTTVPFGPQPSPRRADDAPPP